MCSTPTLHQVLLARVAMEKHNERLRGKGHTCKRNSYVLVQYLITLIANLFGHVVQSLLETGEVLEQLDQR